MKPKTRSKIHQLTDMEIHEVSLVDHAANKRRFLIAKRSDSMSEDAPEAVEEPSEPIPETPPGAVATPSADTEQSEMRGLLREVLQALKTSATASPKPAAPATAPPEGDGETAAAMEVAKVLHKRLTRLEKQVGLPQSISPEASTPRRNGHVWPFDINRPVDELEEDQ